MYFLFVVMPLQVSIGQLINTGKETNQSSSNLTGQKFSCTSLTLKQIVAWV